MKINQDILLSIINHSDWVSQKEILNLAIKSSSLDDIIELKEKATHEKPFKYVYLRKLQDLTKPDSLKENLEKLKNAHLLSEFSSLIKTISHGATHFTLDTIDAINSVYFNASNYEQFTLNLINSSEFEKKSSILQLLSAHTQIEDMVKLYSPSFTELAKDSYFYFLDEKLFFSKDNNELFHYLSVLNQANLLPLPDYLIQELLERQFNVDSDTFNYLTTIYPMDENDKLNFIYSKLKKQDSYELEEVFHYLNKLHVKVTHLNDIQDTEKFLNFFFESLTTVPTLSFLKVFKQLTSHFTPDMLLGSVVTEKTLNLKKAFILDNIEESWKKLSKHPENRENANTLLNKLNLYQDFNQTLDNLFSQNYITQTYSNDEYFNAQHTYIKHGLRKTLNRLKEENKDADYIQTLHTQFEIIFEKEMFESQIKEVEPKLNRKTQKI